MRGQLTEAVKEKAKELLNIEITETELRLMPYIQYRLMNEQTINPQHLRREEWKIYLNWFDEGYLTGNPYEYFNVTKNFWNAMSEILYISYVNQQ